MTTQVCVICTAFLSILNWPFRFRVCIFYLSLIVAHESAPLIRFDPPVPTVSMIHVCIATLTAHDTPADASQPLQLQHVRQHDEQGALTMMQQVLQNVALSTGIRCLGQVLRPRWVQNSHHNDRTELILNAEFNMVRIISPILSSAIISSIFFFFFLSYLAHVAHVVPIVDI